MSLRLFRRRRSRERGYLVEVDENTWLRVEARSMEEAERKAVAQVPFGRGPWTVRIAHGEPEQKGEHE